MFNAVVSDVFTTVSAGSCVAVTVTVSGADGVPVPTCAVAMLVTVPASRSAWVTVSVPVQVRLAFGTRPPAGSAGQTTLSIRSSDTVTGSVRVTFPVLRTV